jgi:CDP-paratose 2-epimerase
MGEEPRVGDHMWWITDLDRFRADYPSWDLEIDLERIVRELHDHNVERWTSAAS